MHHWLSLSSLTLFLVSLSLAVTTGYLSFSLTLFSRFLYLCFPLSLSLSLSLVSMTHTREFSIGMPFLSLSHLVSLFIFFLRKNPRRSHWRPALSRSHVGVLHVSCTVFSPYFHISVAHTNAIAVCRNICFIWLRPIWLRPSIYFSQFLTHFLLPLPIFMSKSSTRRRFLSVDMSA